MPADGQRVRRRVPGLQDQGRGDRQGAPPRPAGNAQQPQNDRGNGSNGSCRLQVYFEVAKPQPDGPGIDYSQLDDSCRFIQYQFPAEVLSLNNIGTTCAAAAVDLQPHAC